MLLESRICFLQMMWFISTSKSEVIVISQKRVELPLWVGGELLPQVDEFKYLVLFTSEGRGQPEIDRQIGSAATVMQTLYMSVVVKRECKSEALIIPVDLHP